MILALASASVVSGLAQDATALKTPVIVARLVLQNQTQPLGSSTAPILLFTPSHDGFYRATFYVGQNILQQQCNCVNLILNEGPNFLINYWENSQSQVFAFPGAANQSIYYYTEFEGVPNSPYGVTIVVEEL
jgi:hypothetical protein